MRVRNVHCCKCYKLLLYLSSLVSHLRSDVLNLRQMSVGRSRDLSPEKRVETLSNNVPKGGEHGDAAVGHLSLAVTFDLLDGGVLGKSEGIEVSNGRERTGETGAEGVGIGGPALWKDSEGGVVSYGLLGLSWW